MDGWYRELQNGRVEITCEANDHRIRVTAPAEHAWEAVDLFERWTGRRVEHERRPPRQTPQLPGQIAMSELESA